MAYPTDNPMDGRGTGFTPVTPAADEDGGIYAEGCLVCVRPKRIGNGVTLGGSIAEAQNEATAQAIALRCAAFEPMLAALKKVEQLWRCCVFEDGGTYDCASREVSAAIARAEGR